MERRSKGAERQARWRERQRELARQASSVMASECPQCGGKLTEINRVCRKCAHPSRTGIGAKNPFIEFNGIRYYRDAQGWRASPCNGHGRLHRAIWEAEFGSIPRGHQLIYADGNPENNALTNLLLRAPARPPRSARQQNGNAMTHELLDEHEAAQRLRRPVSTMRFWRTKGRGGPRYLKMGRRVFYRGDWIDEYLAACEAQS